MIPSRQLEPFRIEIHRIYSFPMQFFNGFLHIRVKELNVFLLLVASLITLADPFRIDVPLIDVRCNVLFRPQETAGIDGGVLAGHVHHGNIEIEA